MTDFEIVGNTLVKYNGYRNDVVIPASVTEIGVRAFSSNTLRSVVIPDSVTEIGEYAFAGCIYLERVVLPKE